VERRVEPDQSRVERFAEGRLFGRSGPRHPRPLRLFCPDPFEIGLRSLERPIAADGNADGDQRRDREQDGEGIDGGHGASIAYAERVGVSRGGECPTASRAR
jgi:hypothetical protein